MYQGIWETICDDGWDDTDATVVCRELGYSHEMQQDMLTLDQVLVLCGYTKLAVWKMRVNYHTVYTLGLAMQGTVHIRKMQ